MPSIGEKMKASGFQHWTTVVATRVAFLCGLFVFLCAHRADGGPMPMPLEAQLDLASRIVVGKITEITPVEENLGPGSHCGRATVEVAETLKGDPAKTIQFLVVTKLVDGWQGDPAPHVPGG